MNIIKNVIKLKRLLETTPSVNGLSSESIDKLIELFDVPAVSIKYDRTITSPLRLVLDFYKEYNPLFYEIIVDGIKNDRIIIGPQCSKSYVNVDKKLGFIKTTATDHDVYVMVHEMAHYVNVVLNNKYISRENCLYTEVFSYYMERKFDKYLEKFGYYELIFARYQNRTKTAGDAARTIKDFLTIKRMYECGSLALLGESEKIENVLNSDKRDIVAFNLRYLIGTLYSRVLAKEEESEEFIKQIESLDLDEEIEKFRRENVTLIFK